MAMTGSEGIEVVNTYQRDAPIPRDIEQRYFGVHDSWPPKRVHLENQKKRPFGWSLWALLTLAAIISAVIVGAGVGSGLGIRVAKCEKSEPTPAPVETPAPADPTASAETAACTTAGPDITDTSNDSSGYAPKLPQDIANLTQPAECAERGGPNQHKSTSGLNFTFYCSMDVSIGDGTRDVVGIVAYTFSNCIDACAIMHQYFVKNKNGTDCDSLVFGWQISKAWEAFGSNCWLKSGKVADKIAFNQPQYIYAEAPE